MQHEMPRSSDLTTLLVEANDGDAQAFDQIWALVYDDLKRVAEAQLRRERASHPLRAAGLVHEVYLKLAEGAQPVWRSRAQFLAIAARVMRQVLVDRARARAAQKRGGGRARAPLAGRHVAVDSNVGELLWVDDVLDRLGAMDERLRDVVELRFFDGLTEREVADVLGLSERTIQRDWAKARAWLHHELDPEAAGSETEPSETEL